MLQTIFWEHMLDKRFHKYRLSNNSVYIQNTFINAFSSAKGLVCQRGVVQYVLKVLISHIISMCTGHYDAKQVFNAHDIVYY